MKQGLGPFILSALLGLSGQPLLAQETPPGPPLPWKVSLEFSYLETSGNTNTSALMVAGKGEYDFSDSKILGEGKGLYGRSNDVTSEKSWFLRAEYDYNLSERTVAFLIQSAERDTLKGIEGRYISQAGIGHYFVKTHTDELKAEAGGVTHEKIRFPLIRAGDFRAPVSLSNITINFQKKQSSSRRVLIFRA